ncbi:hypothetical protein DRP53_04105 [candidate division WOR-3 bacterium]|uniref:Uncharacterized protein n=1 Tax=candidate division WOR-3 bacterium TaxID=2052148 RepID=A0A660SJ38_UNCW3|nr:MAG: hypothetical protein DRP53_04105 [candidate division WOR-3 bacterium]
MHQNGIYLAEKEKAFLDQLYFVYKGIASMDRDEINLKPLSRKKLISYVRKYPKQVEKLLSQYISILKL